MADPYAELQQQVQAIIDHGPAAGFGPEAVNSLVENTFSKENGSYGYLGEYEPNEVVVTEPFEVMRHAEIVQKVNTLAAESISTSSLNWNDLAAAAREGSDGFRNGIEAAMNSGWSGPTSTAVRGGVGDYTSSATALSTAMTMISNKLLEAHAGFTQTRAAMPPIVDIGVGATMLESSFPSGLPFADSIKAIARLHDEQEEQARQVMRSVYVPGVLQSDAQVPVLPAAHNPVADGGNGGSTPGWGPGGGSTWGGGGGSAESEGPADAAAPEPPPSGADSADTGQPGTEPGQPGSGQPGSLPAAERTGETRAASASAPGGGPMSGGSAGSANGYGGSGYNGSGYSGGAGYGGGAGSGSGSGYAGSGYAGSGYGSILGSPLGGNGTTGGGPGSGGPGSGGPGSAAAAAAGRAGAHGTPGMGGMGAGGARGSGDNDTDHTTPGYLVDVSNGSELIGDLPLVAPPVLGG